MKSRINSFAILVFTAVFFMYSCGPASKKESGSEESQDEIAVTEPSSDQETSNEWIESSDASQLSSTWVDEEDKGELSNTWAEDAFS
jgi:hypothetical protein